MANFRNMHLMIAFNDLLHSSIAPQIKPPFLYELLGNSKEVLGSQTTRPFFKLSLIFLCMMKMYFFMLKTLSRKVRGDPWVMDKKILFQKWRRSNNFKEFFCFLNILSNNPRFTSVVIKYHLIKLGVTVTPKMDIFFWKKSN